MSHFPGEHASLWPEQCPPRETPARGSTMPAARRPPPGLQVRGPDGRDARACQPAFQLPPATLDQARPPRASRHRTPAAAAHPERTGGEPAASPAPRALPWEPVRRRTGGGGGGSEGGGGGARPEQERSGGERRRAEGSGSHNGRARGAEPPAPRALAAAAEAEPAQPPNRSPTPGAAPRPPMRAPRPAPHPRPFPRAPRALRTDPASCRCPRVLSLGPSPGDSSPAAARIPGASSHPHIPRPRPAPSVSRPRGRSLTRAWLTRPAPLELLIPGPGGALPSCGALSPVPGLEPARSPACSHFLPASPKPIRVPSLPLGLLLPVPRAPCLSTYPPGFGN